MRILKLQGSNIYTLSIPRVALLLDTLGCLPLWQKLSYRTNYSSMKFSFILSTDNPFFFSWGFCKRLNYNLIVKSTASYPATKCFAAARKKVSPNPPPPDQGSSSGLPVRDEPHTDLREAPRQAQDAISTRI
jgi:hypothetical protein